VTTGVKGVADAAVKEVAAPANDREKWNFLLRIRRDGTLRITGADRVVGGGRGVVVLAGRGLDRGDEHPRDGALS
jgi:hypothetical protein